MMRDRWRTAFRAVLVVVIGSVVFLSTAGAEEATPQASPVVSGSVDCPTDERLTVEKLRELGATPAPGEPEAGAAYHGGATPPPGEPADAGKVAAVTATIRQYFACVDAGDWPAAYALNDDDTIRFLVTDPAREVFGVDPTTADYPFLTAEPKPLRHPHGRIAVSDVTVLPDGRVSATIKPQSNQRRDQNGANVALLQRVDGRWRIISPLRRLPSSTRLAMPPQTPLPVYLTPPGCPDDQRLTVEKLRELGSTPAPQEPVPPTTYFDIDSLPPGGAVDAATAKAVAKTIRQYFSCVDSREWAAAFAFYTDDTLRYLITDPTRSFMDVNPTTADYPFLRQQRGLTDGSHGRIDVYQVTRRPDGRIGAAIAVEEELRRANRGIQYIVLAWENGHWRLVSPLSSLAFPYGVNPAAP